MRAGGKFKFMHSASASASVNDFKPIIKATLFGVFVCAHIGIISKIILKTGPNACVTDTLRQPTGITAATAEKKKILFENSGAKQKQL